ncbi:MAG TPA: hypothetical protein VHY22_03105, partial [Chthoniobacteraceae bacterium]|nr:hypothetical protein [Chthoniobacteraceae bacterium]
TPSHIYTYTIDGEIEVTGSGVLDSIGGGEGNEDFDEIVELIAPGIVGYLQGSVVDVSGKNPFTIVNNIAAGTFPFLYFENGIFGDEVSGMLRLKAGIEKSGVPYLDFTNFSVKLLIPPAGYRLDKADSYTFTSGSMTISAVGASGSSAAPDLGIMGADSAFIGIGLTGSDGSNQTYGAYLEHGVTESASVVLLNSGSSAGTFTLTAPAVSSTTGFIQKFILGGKDVTAAITGSNGYTTKSIGGGDVQTLNWDVTNKTTSSGTFNSLVTAVTSGTSVSGTDAVGLYLIAP